MKHIIEKKEVIKKILNQDNFLIIQDLDGVCIPLVQDPLKREINIKYVEATSILDGSFSVLTCGEHEGERGVNRLIEKALNSVEKASRDGLYLPGLAACGVEFQDRFGNVSHPGLKSNEIKFLSQVPTKMKSLLEIELKTLLPNTAENKISRLINVAVCDTHFTPTLNLNEIFSYVKDDFEKIKSLQFMMEKIMNDLIDDSKENGLENSFYLHMMPNLGTKNEKEIMKYATKNDYGTTDIQFIINGAIKEAGLLVILNKYISSKTGVSPFGEDFNVRTAPKSLDKLLGLCLENIPKNQMPLLIGVGDTVTSTKDNLTDTWLRGGSDRQFLTLIQKIGKAYNKDNQVIFVNSGNDQVSRPRVQNSKMDGISDVDDDLEFNMIINNGPEEYISWFRELASRILKNK